MYPQDYESFADLRARVLSSPMANLPAQVPGIGGLRDEDFLRSQNVRLACALQRLERCKDEFGLWEVTSKKGHAYVRGALERKVYERRCALFTLSGDLSNFVADLSENPTWHEICVVESAKRAIVLQTNTLASSISSLGDKLRDSLRQLKHYWTTHDTRAKRCYIFFHAAYESAANSMSEAMSCITDMILDGETSRPWSPTDLHEIAAALSTFPALSLADLKSAFPGYYHYAIDSELMEQVLQMLPVICLENKRGETRASASQIMFLSYESVSKDGTMYWWTAVNAANNGCKQRSFATRHKCASAWLHALAGCK